MKSIREMNEMEIAELACKTMMKKYQAENLPPEGHFHYHQGVFLSGVEKTFFSTGRREYADYIQKWIDSLITDDGEVMGYDPMTLDDKQAATLLFRIIDETGNEKYEKALHFIKGGLDNWPLAEGGGFWHKIKDDVKNQMWLDGLYMAGELLTRYGVRYDGEKSFDIVFRQAELMWKNMRDEKTGLLYHAWDVSKEIGWADKKTGLSPEFWGRAAGWYIVALMTILEYLPDGYKHKEELIGYAQEYIKAFTKYQDDETGLWYQILDKGERTDNWLETSCSALFLCGISKALKLGYIDEKYRENADRAFEGIRNKIEDDGSGGLILPFICVGTGVGSYKYYIERPTGENDLHGMGALLLALNAYHEIN